MLTQGLWTKWAGLLQDQQTYGFCSCKSENADSLFINLDSLGIELHWLTTEGVKDLFSSPLSPVATGLWFWMLKPGCWAASFSLTEQMFQELLSYVVLEEKNKKSFVFSGCVFSVTAQYF